MEVPNILSEVFPFGTQQKSQIFGVLVVADNLDSLFSLYLDFLEVYGSAEV